MLRHKVVLLSALLALAVSAPASRAGDDLVSHARIVRISYVEGTVQLNNENATMNAPLIENSRLVTASDGLAEVQLEDGSTIRLAPQTDITFSQLGRLASGGTVTAVDLTDGEAEFKIASHEGSQVVVNAHNKNISLRHSGRFRVLSTNSNPLELAVWSGQVAVRDSESGQEVMVRSNETFTLGLMDPAQYQLEKGIASDELDQWSDQRDQYLSTYVVSNAVSSQSSYYPSGSSFAFNDYCGAYYGYGYGYGYGWQPNWLYSPGFGNCWNSGFFFPWGFWPQPNFVLLPVPFPRHRPPHIHPPAPPAAAVVIAKPGAALPTVKPGPGEAGGRMEGHRVFNDENFKRSLPPSEAEVHAKAGEKQPATEEVHPQVIARPVETPAKGNSEKHEHTAHTQSGAHSSGSSQPSHNYSPPSSSSGSRSSSSGSLSHSSSGGSHTSSGGSHSSSGSSHSSGSHK